MKFLVDESLSLCVAEALAAAGHDAVHVTALGLAGTPDERVMTTARIGGARDGGVWRDQLVAQTGGSTRAVRPAIREAA